MEVTNGLEVCDRVGDLKDILLKHQEQADSTDDDNDSDVPDLTTSDDEDDDDDELEPEELPLAELRDLSHRWCQAPSNRSLFSRGITRFAQQPFFGPLPQRTGSEPTTTSNWKPPTNVQEVQIEEKVDVKEALQRYIRKLQGKNVASGVCPPRRAVPLVRRDMKYSNYEQLEADEGGMQLPESLLPRGPSEIEEGLRQEATASRSKEPALGKQAAFKKEQGAMEERLCRHCNLPMGCFSYNRDGKQMHAECMAQLLVHEMKRDEEARKEKEQQRKSALREEYDIGWDAKKQVPGNNGAVYKLVRREVPQGMVCLVVDGEQTVSLAATIEPAAAVNLEYLSTCLKVRCRDGTEPMFSLDPVDPLDRNSMQEKVFHPEWLAGTSVGEVLFQADYHLKELSMGEYNQPVVGMKSGFDYAEVEGQEKEWSAREWFIVRKAEVQITENNVLIPSVKMGIEAREQILIDDVLEDAPITRQDHPMVKYADIFTQNFDLIAERKSVIFHLRELAKAAVMAKFLIECPEVNVEESWIRLAKEKEMAYALEVPQLWNQRTHSQIHVKDGKMSGEKNDELARARGIYGGVSFGLGKFPELGAAVSAMMPRLSSVRVAASGLSAAPPPILPDGTAVPRVEFGFRAASGDTSGRLPLQLGRKLIAARIDAKERINKQFGAPAVSAGAALSAAAAPALPPPPKAPAAPTKRFLFPYKGLSANVGTKVPIGLDKSGLTKLGERLGLTAGAAKRPQLLTPVERAPGAQISRKVIGGGSGYGLGGFRAAKRPAAPAISAGPAAAPAALGAAAAPPGADLQGVDLRLDRFDMSAPKRLILQASAIHSLDTCVAMGDAFWACLDSDAEVRRNDSLQLLREVFHPKLSDRRAEGDRFIPPDTSYEYVAKLRDLVQQEEAVREQRKEVFFSDKFSTQNPGHLFPSAWTSSFEVSNGRTKAQMAEQGALHARPDYLQEAELLSHLLNNVQPTFDKHSEDGVRFRIYRVGLLDIRTVQEIDGDEFIGAVFSNRAPKKASLSTNDESKNDSDKLKKVTEYVEHAYKAPIVDLAEPAPEPDAEPAPSAKVEEPGFFHRYYVVIETQSGRMIRSEQLEDGIVTFEDNPEDLEDRNSLAKVIRVADCAAPVTVFEFKRFQSTLAQRVATRADRKRYSGSAYQRALGNLSATEVMEAWQRQKSSGVQAQPATTTQSLANVQLQLMAKTFTWK